MSEHVGLNGHASSGAHLNGSAAPATDGEAHEERAQLEAALAAKADALEAAKERLQQKEALIKSVLRDELLASRERLAAMDRDHDERVAAIRAAARAEVERLAEEFSAQEGGAS